MSAELFFVCSVGVSESKDFSFEVWDFQGLLGARGVEFCSRSKHLCLKVSSELFLRVLEFKEVRQVGYNAGRPNSTIAEE